MQYKNFMQVVILLWSCAFCIVAALCMLLSNNYDKNKRKCLIFMQSFTALLLANDALAYYFRGYPGTLGSVMVHLSNFIVFFMSEIILIGFHSFVIFCRDIDERTFNKNIDKIRTGIERRGASASVGLVWSDGQMTLKDMFSEADKLMYAEKEKYYNGRINPRHL